MDQNTTSAYVPFDAEPPATPTPAVGGRFGTRLTRSRDERMVAGVCGGVGRAYGIDPTLLRLGLVLLTIFGVGAGIVVYLAAWILVPQEL